MRNLDEAARIHAMLPDGRPDMMELGAAIAALRGDDTTRDRALEQLRKLGAPVKRPTRPFGTDALRRLWREGFERNILSFARLSRLAAPARRRPEGKDVAKI
jgi:hypothetical protein